MAPQSPEQVITPSSNPSTPSTPPLPSTESNNSSTLPSEQFGTNNSQVSTPTPPPQPTHKANPLPAILIIVALVLVTAGVIFATMSQNKKKSTTTYTNPFNTSHQSQMAQQPTPAYTNPFIEPSPTYANPFDQTQNQTSENQYQNPFEGQK